jgi:hypothetical protein
MEFIKKELVSSVAATGFTTENSLAVLTEQMILEHQNDERFLEIYFDMLFYDIITAYFLLPSALCRVVPYLFLYGQSGSGKSTLAKMASYLHGIDINSSSDTFGQALSLLIAKGQEALEAEATGKGSYLLEVEYLYKHLQAAYTTACASHEEVGDLLVYVENRLDRSCLEEIVEQEGE